MDESKIVVETLMPKTGLALLCMRAGVVVETLVPKTGVVVDERRSCC